MAKNAKILLLFHPVNPFNDFLPPPLDKFHAPLRSNPGPATEYQYWNMEKLSLGVVTLWKIVWIAYKTFWKTTHGILYVAVAIKKGDARSPQIC